MALSVMMSVTVVEAFVNVYFRVIISEPSFEIHGPIVLNDLAKRTPLSLKLRDWPKKVLGKDIPANAPAAVSFKAIRDLRNDLMHFTSTHQTFEASGIVIHGMSNTEPLDTLTKADARRALVAAEGIIREIFVARGVTSQNLPAAMHSWSGQPSA